MAASAAGGGVEQGIDRRAAMVHGGSLGKTDAVVTGLAMENHVEIALCDECETGVQHVALGGFPHFIAAQYIKSIGYGFGKMWRDVLRDADGWQAVG